MTNRREFLQIGITATAAWPLASGAAQAAMAGLEGSPLPLYRIVYDQRFGESRAFAERSLALGFEVHAIEGDMTRFWYDDLYHEWQRRPVAIAGLTAHGPLFCFDQLGRDRGLRVVFQAEHRPADGSIRHEINGPSPMLRRSEALGRAGASWPASMADIVAHCPRGRSEITNAAATTAPASTGPGGNAEPLYTWVIAPAARSREA